MNKIAIYTTPELYPRFCYLGSTTPYLWPMDFAEKHFFKNDAEMIFRAKLLNKLPKTVISK
jgi:hypothetical protein